MNRETAFDILAHDDEAIRQNTSLEGRAVLLLLCAEAAIIRGPIDKMDRLAIKDCYHFLNTCVKFVEGGDVPYHAFEECIASDDESRGFLLHHQNEAGREGFWGFLMAITAWFGAAASDCQYGSSYFAHCEDYDSISSIFSGIDVSAMDISWVYCAEAYRFVIANFPNRGDDQPKTIDFGTTRLLFNKHLAQSA